MFSYDTLVENLFKTNAIEICPKDKPFWYTSNKIGPYYINTDYLYGSKEKSEALLKVINQLSDDKANISSIILDLTLSNYETDETYRFLIDSMIEFTRREIGNYDFISGGERRDWFFSLILAHFLKKPHITLFKDLSTVVFLPQTVTEDINSVDNLKVLHIADIINEASSYERAWVPAIEAFGAKITDSLVVIDRLQGGSEKLSSLDVNSHSLAKVEVELFEMALKKNLIDEAQFIMVENYIADPYNSMRSFLIDNPIFLENSLNSDTKTSQRTKACIEQDLYKLKEN